MIGTTQYVIGPTPISEPYTPPIVVCNKSVIAATLSRQLLNTFFSW